MVYPNMHRTFIERKRQTRAELESAMACAVDLFEIAPPFIERTSHNAGQAR
jgi:lysophospholipase L1-like esterase